MQRRSHLLATLAVVVFLVPTLAIADTVDCDIPKPPEKGGYPAELGIETHAFEGGQLLIRVCDEIGYVDFVPEKYTFAWIGPGGSFRFLREFNYGRASHEVFGEQGLVVIRETHFDRNVDIETTSREELRWSPLLQVLLTRLELEQLDRFNEAVAKNDADAAIKSFEALRASDPYNDWQGPLFENLARVVTRSAMRLNEAGKNNAAIELLEKVFPEKNFGSSTVDGKLPLEFGWSQRLDDTAENASLLDDMATIVAAVNPEPQQEYELQMGRAGQLYTTALQASPSQHGAMRRLADLMWGARKSCERRRYGANYFFSLICLPDEAIQSLYLHYARVVGDKLEPYVLERVGFDPSKRSQKRVPTLAPADPSYSWRSYTANPDVKFMALDCDENTPSGRAFLARIKAGHCQGFRYGDPYAFSDVKGQIRIPQNTRLVATVEEMTPRLLHWFNKNQVALHATCVGGLPTKIKHLRCETRVAISPVVLKRLKELETLELSHYRGNFQQVLEALSALPNLRTLRITNLRDLDESLKRIGSLEKLQTLELSLIDSSSDPDIFKPLSNLQNLRDLRIRANMKAATGLPKTLSKLQSLRSLTVESGHVDEEQLEQLAKLKDLQRLELRIKLTPKSRGLLSLAKLPKLHTLELRNTRLTDADLDEVIQLSQLRALGLSGSLVTQYGVEKLSRMRNLIVLDLDLVWSRNRYILPHDSPAKPLAKLTQLQHLDVGLNKLVGRDVAPLVALKNLQSLNLKYTSFDDLSDLEAIEKLPRLKLLVAEPGGLDRDAFKKWAESVATFDVVPR